MTPLHTANVAIHVAAATLALVVGLVSLFSAKGGAAHRKAGKFVLPAAIIAVAGLSAALWLLIAMGPSTPSFTPAIGYSAIGFVTLLCCYDLSRFAWQELWKRKVWPIDHGLKMVGFYFALVSAAAGNLLRDFQPWSQLIPSVIGVIALTIFAAFYFRRTSAAATI
jgi:uncharacterized membrane protein